MIKEVIFDKKELKLIADYVLENEKHIKSLGPSIYPGTAKDALTGRYMIFNFLNSPIGDILKYKIFKFLHKNNIHEPCAIQCWANTFRKGEGIKQHRHQVKDHELFLCANIFIKGDPNLGTTYIIDGKHVNVKNKPGEIMLFNSRLEHYVDKNPKDSIRISIALDIHERTIFNDTKRFYNWV
jgi:hypothetical protein|tara:strand:- start:416 stop:961 length:546 start_codon:yes stop_codon:yes gene_type:complete